MTDLTDLKTPFGLLDPETQAALKAHGGPYEVYVASLELGRGVWKPIDPVWTDALAVRVKPAPPKPREWWVSGGNCIWDTYAEAYNACDRGEKPVHVREVTTE